MKEDITKPKKMSMTNTKQELLEAYNKALKQLQDKREAELRPEKVIEEKKAKEVVEVAESLSSEGVVKDISNLKIEMGKILNQVSDRLEEEVNKFRDIKKTIEIKEKELEELYGIERSAETLVALIETQNQKRQEFESEMATKKEELRQEIDEERSEWEKEEKEHDAEIKERDAEEKKRREREKEEFGYTFKREQRLAKDRFEDEKAKMEKEIQLEREQMESELTERERAIAEREGELEELRNRVNSFPKEMEAAVNKAIKDTTERINLATKNREELLKKEFDGERNVLTTRNEYLEKVAKEQREEIAKLSQQLENAYQKVQDIAVKTVESSSSIKSLTDLQRIISEQTRKQSQDK